MIYVPILKLREQEKNVTKELKGCFGDKIIPLFEIVSDVYKIRYKTNPNTGEYLYRRSKNDRRNERIKEERTEDDIITLDYLNDLIEGKKCFIDFFRFTTDKYSKLVDINKVILSWRISNDYDLYKNKIQSLLNYTNFIPVISIKPGFEMKEQELTSFIKDIKNDFKRSIALRITDDYLYNYKELIKKLLSYDDYLLFDIEEQPILSKDEELRQLDSLDISAKIVLVNSPRKKAFTNREFPKKGYVSFIDNGVINVTKKYKFEGFSDYCGYKDVLPLTSKSNGKGAALILFYVYEKNQFFSLCEPNTQLGVGGYKDLKKELLDLRSEFDPNNNCLAYDKVVKMKKHGSWKDWNNVCIRRYIHEMYKNQNDF
jgi:hypothetical protein